MRHGNYSHKKLCSRLTQGFNESRYGLERTMNIPLQKDSARSNNETEQGKKGALQEIHQLVHMRKVRAIQDQKEPYIVDISQFAQRQNNIVLNALSFINEVSEGGVNEEEKEETKQQQDRDGVDFGYNCRLPAEHLKLPEV